MIKLENVSFSYQKERDFIKDLSLEFEGGKITTILGPNGSGKSTLLHMISTYLKPKSGKIYLNDMDLKKLKQKEIAKYISCVYQEHESPDDITVRDLVSFGRNIYTNKDENEKMIDFALDATGISDIQNKKVNNLSGG
ncbi:ABC transporter ATP-binding protein, partial [Intestinibacter sp.]|uniref:ABC transporter ATP-binding protein n=1 Tax=Intestinibacter sp. TaxID=1965304 RepID=UPI003F15ADAD